MEGFSVVLVSIAVMVAFLVSVRSCDLHENIEKYCQRHFEKTADSLKCIREIKAYREDEKK